MMKTKVTEFIGRIQDGGAETLVKDYALMLDKDLFDVTILCEDYKKNSVNYQILKENNVHIVTMYENSFFINRVLARILGKRYVALLFKRAVKKIKPDVIHAHLEVLEIMYHARKALKGIKLLFTCHNPPQMLIGEKRPKERAACRYLLDHNCLQIIALHEQMAQEINEMFDIDDTKVIRNGVDFERFRNVKRKKENIRRDMDLPVDAYVIGQVSRFAYQKNPEFTVNVFAELLKKRENSYLLLVGRGKQENQLREQVRDLGIEDHVRILVNRRDIPQLLKAMDVFILPSRFEGLGIVLIEAQVAGIPCVVSENIPKEAYQSKKITVLNLSDPIDTWVKALLRPRGNISEYGNLDDYDMKKEIKNLESLYLC